MKAFPTLQLRLATLVALAASAAVSAAPVAKVLSLFGDVYLERAGARKVLAKGSSLELSDFVQTGPRARARLEFNDRDADRNAGPTVLNLAPDSRVQISSFVVKKDDPASSRGVLDLLRGAVRAFTKGWGKRSQFSIRTGTSLCGIRGSGMIVWLEPNPDPTSPFPYVTQVGHIDGNVFMDARDNLGNPGRGAGALNVPRGRKAVAPSDDPTTFYLRPFLPSEVERFLDETTVPGGVRDDLRNWLDGTSGGGGAAPGGRTRLGQAGPGMRGLASSVLMNVSNTSMPLPALTPMSTAGVRDLLETGRGERGGLMAGDQPVVGFRGGFYADGNHSAGQITQGESFVADIRIDDDDDGGYPTVVLDDDDDDVDPDYGTDFYPSSGGPLSAATSTIPLDGRGFVLDDDDDAFDFEAPAGAEYGGEFGYNPNTPYEVCRDNLSMFGGGFTDNNIYAIRKAWDPNSRIPFDIIENAINALRNEDPGANRNLALELLSFRINNRDPAHGSVIIEVRSLLTIGTNVPQVAIFQVVCDERGGYRIGNIIMKSGQFFAVGNDPQANAQLQQGDPNASGSGSSSLFITAAGVVALTQTATAATHETLALIDLDTGGVKEFNESGISREFLVDAGANFSVDDVGFDVLSVDSGSLFFSDASAFGHSSPSGSARIFKCSGSPSFNSIGSVASADFPSSAGASGSIMIPTSPPGGPFVRTHTFGVKTADGRIGKMTITLTNPTGSGVGEDVTIQYSIKIMSEAGVDYSEDGQSTSCDP